MFHQKILFLLKIIFLVLFSSLPVFAADIKNQDPFWFVNDKDWLSYDEVKQMLEPDVSWCFEYESKNETCSFFTIAKGEQKNTEKLGQYFAYDVVELWDSKIILSTPMNGVLYADGKLCEQGIDWIDNISAYNLKGVQVSDEQLQDMKSELLSDWKIDENTKYCFTYARVNSKNQQIITQFLYTNGQFSGESLNFILAQKPNAKIRYKLRLD